MLHAGDAGGAFTDAQTHPGGSRDRIWHLDGIRHVRAIGGGCDEHLAITNDGTINSNKFHQQEIFAGPHQTADNDLATLDELVGGGLADHDGLGLRANWGDGTGSQREQEQVSRIDRHGTTVGVKGAQTQLAKLRYPVQLELDLLVEVNPIGGVADNPLRFTVEQARLTARLERLDPQLHVETAGGHAAQVGNHVQGRSHPGHRARHDKLDPSYGKGGSGSDGGSAGWPVQRRSAQVSGAGNAGCSCASESWVEGWRSGDIPIRRGNRRLGEGGRPGGKIGGGVAAGGAGGSRSSQPGLEGLIENTGEVAGWEGSGSRGGL